MFFFFLDNRLSDNIIVQTAFQNQCFKKIIEKGYCDMNIFFGKPAIRKELIIYNLELKKSPLAILFRKPYADNIEEAAERLSGIMGKYAWDGNIIDEFSEFAIVYYIYKSLRSNERREEFTREILESWQRNLLDNTFVNEKEMDLRISNGIIFDNNEIELNIVNTINQYMSLLDNISMKKDKLFFRGHGDVSYKLVPSVFRKEKWMKNEKLMYQELQINCANELSEKKGHLEILAEMQHYGLPTRLLDITKNPLIALFFACEKQDKHSGEVIIFSVKREEIKYPQSDTVAVLSSLPLFTFQEQKEYYHLSKKTYSKNEQFNKDIERLVQEIRIERPGFIGKIRQEDLRKCIVVIPAINNRRLERQEGAFIICGLLDENYGYSKRNSIDDLRAKSKDGKKIVCIINDKEKILRQLNSLGVNKSKIYPEIDDVADYIKNNVDML